MGRFMATQAREIEKIHEGDIEGRHGSGLANAIGIRDQNHFVTLDTEQIAEDRARGFVVFDK
jgi:hypothetical protein